MPPKSCARCHRPGKALCDSCRNSRRVNPKYHDKEYLGNRARMIKIAWESGLPCWLCNLPFLRREDITADHIVTLRDGGSHDLANLAPAHEKCNKGRFRKKKEAPPPAIDPDRDNNSFLDWL